MRPFAWTGKGRLSGFAARNLILLLFLLPLFMGIVAAFRPSGEIFRYGIELSLYSFLPLQPTLENFRDAMARPFFLQQIANTFFVGLLQPTATAILAVLAAFPLARMDFRGKNMLFAVIVATLFLPFEAIVVPMFILVRDLGMQGNYVGLILPWIASPLAVFLLRQAMMDIPRELDEAVLVDGGGLWTVLKTAILPNIWPALVTVWLFTFVFVWDSYLWPLVILDEPDEQMAQIGLIAFLGELKDGVPYGTVFASALLAIGPVLIVFVFLQRFYVRGIALSGLK